MINDYENVVDEYVKTSKKHQAGDMGVTMRLIDDEDAITQMAAKIQQKSGEMNPAQAQRMAGISAKKAPYTEVIAHGFRGAFAIAWEQMEVTFFSTPAEFRKWLRRHHETTKELWVGFHKKHTGRPSMTWPESVDEALCVGWIDGIRKTIDEDSYAIRFTPRRRGSIWSAVNIGRATVLANEQRMRLPVMAAFKARIENKSGIYSYEQRSAQLPEPFAGTLRKNSVGLEVLPGPAAFLSQSNRLVDREREKGGDAAQAPGEINRGIGPRPTIAIRVRAKDIPVEGRRKSSTIPDAKNLPGRSARPFIGSIRFFSGPQPNDRRSKRAEAGRIAQLGCGGALDLIFSPTPSPAASSASPSSTPDQAKSAAVAVEHDHRAKPGSGFSGQTKSSQVSNTKSDCFTGDRENIGREVII